MGGGSINGRTKFDALLVMQIRLRKMPLVGMRQGNTGAEVAAGRGVARDQDKGFDEFLRRLRTGVVTYIHPQRRYVTVAIMVDGKEIKESFRPEEVLA